jgi:hypothetical protein
MHAPMFERIVDTLLFPARVADGVQRVARELGRVVDDVTDIRLVVESLPSALTRLDAGVQPVSTVEVELAEIRGLVERLNFQLEQVTQRLPDPDSAGPLERARDVLTGKDPT